MSERVSAFHEAGHAVAALLCGEHLHCLQIARGGGTTLVDQRERSVERVFGLTETSMGSIQPEILRTMMEGAPSLHSIMAANVFRHVFLDGAGEAAEAKAAHTSRLAVRLSGGSGGDWKHSVGAVEGLGFDRAEAKRLVDETWDRTGRLVTGKDGWPAVVSIAEAALAGETDGERLELIGRALLPHAPTSIFGVEPVYLPAAVRLRFPGPYVAPSDTPGRPATRQGQPSSHQ